MSEAVLTVRLRERNVAEAEEIALSDHRVWTALNVHGPHGLAQLVEEEAARRGWRIEEASQRALRQAAISLADRGMPGEPIDVLARRSRVAARTRGAGETAAAEGPSAVQKLIDTLQAHTFLWVYAKMSLIEALQVVRDAARELKLDCHLWNESDGFEPPPAWAQGSACRDLQEALNAVRAGARQEGARLLVFQHIEAYLYQYAPQGLPGPYLVPFQQMVADIRSSEAISKVVVLAQSEHGSRVPEPLSHDFYRVVLRADGQATPTLDEIVYRDWTAAARRGEVDPLYDVDGLVARIVEIFVAGWNPLLVGPPGVGKSALVADLARRILDGKLLLLKGRRVAELSVATLLGGTQLRGTLERRVADLVDEVRENRDEVIVFIDEIHTLVDNRDAAEAAEMLKGTLARGEFPLIGATTDAEVVKLEQNPALASRFQKIPVPPPNAERLSAILEARRNALSKRYKLPVLKEAAKQAARLSELVPMGGEGQPRRAIQLLEFACARALTAGAFQVEAAHVEAVARDQSGGIQTDRARRQGLADRLKRRVRFQDKVVETVARAAAAFLDGQGLERGPLSFLFLGPSGTGKSSLARHLAEELLGDRNALLHIPLEQYSSQHTSANLFGAPPGYIGHDQRPGLVLHAQRWPNGIFLFDELEKAHSDVATAFLTVLETGVFQDSTGSRADLSRAIFIFTSNALLEARNVNGEEGLRQQAKEAFRRVAEERALLGGAAGAGVPEPFLNRLDYVLLFQPLSAEQVRQLAHERLQQELSRYAQRGVEVDCSHLSLSIYLAVSDDAARDEGARLAVRKVEAFVRELRYFMSEHDIKTPTRLRARYDVEAQSLVFEKERS